MTLRMQALLLRFLETGEIQKVGAERQGRASDVRVMAATNRDLRELIAQGQFREDLFYRLNVIHIVVPPLRDRRDDVPLLVEHFLRLIASSSAYAASGTLVQSVSPEAMNALTEYSWPGNIRQLRNMIERLVVTGRNEIVELNDLLTGSSKCAGPASAPRQP